MRYSNTSRIIETLWEIELEWDLAILPPQFQENKTIFAIIRVLFMLWQLWTIGKNFDVRGGRLSGFGGVADEPCTSCRFHGWYSVGRHSQSKGYMKNNWLFFIISTYKPPSVVSSHSRDENDRALLAKSRDEENHLKKYIDLLLHSIVLDCLPEYCNKITPLNAFRKYSL